MTKNEIGHILARRSIRAYTKKPVSEEDTRTLLDAAMAAPSASNRKPWHFITVTDRSTLDSLAKVKQAAGMLRQAPLCIVPCGDASISEGYWVQDLSAATENILLAATALSLGSVWIGIHPIDDRVKPVKEILGIPKNIVPLCLIAIGHPAEEKEPRTQYDAARVHREKW